MVFTRLLYVSWFLFLDDLTVATGRPSCLGPGPSGAHDVTEQNLSFSADPEKVCCAVCGCTECMCGRDFGDREAAENLASPARFSASSQLLAERELRDDR